MMLQYGVVVITQQDVSIKFGKNMFEITKVSIHSLDQTIGLEYLTGLLNCIFSVSCVQV